VADSQDRCSADSEMAMTDLWRVGTDRRRTTIYRQEGSEPSENDAPIGAMSTPELADKVVEDHNAQNRLRQSWSLVELIEPGE
jgi:hypothetical protein